MKFEIISCVVCIWVTSVNAFMQTLNPARRQMITKSSMSLNEEVILKLDNLKSKYDSLANLGTPEAEEEKSLIEDVVQKYSTYKEIKLMMNKLRKMWRTEESERRRARQLNSFISLYKGRVEIEEALKEKLGFPADKKAAETLKGLQEVKKWEEQIVALEKKLESVEIKLPKGMSTREERFGS